MNIIDIWQANRAAGSHWFDPSTMRFFRTRVSSTVYPFEGGAAFVTSEQYDDTSPSLYTVRVFHAATGGVGTAEGHEFQEFASRSGAHAAARRYAEAQS